MKTIQETLRDTDWTLLHQQKLTLISAMWLATSKEERADLEGIVAWVDAIQDAVVHEGLAAEEAVFPASEDDAEDEGTGHGDACPICPQDEEGRPTCPPEDRMGAALSALGTACFRDGDADGMGCVSDACVEGDECPACEARRILRGR